MATRKIASRFLFCVFLIGCSSSAHIKDEAEDSVSKFHELYNAKRFAEIFQTADGDFKTAGTQDEFTTSLESVQDRLGMIERVTISELITSVTVQGRFIIIRYDSEFKNGRAKEEFVFKEYNGRLLLYDFKISSPVLLDKNSTPARVTPGIRNEAVKSGLRPG